MTTLVGAFAPTPASGIEPGQPVVILKDGVNGCNGIRPTPGSENTTKRIDPDYPNDFNAGGVVGYIIDYPVDPTDVSGRTTFEITDCIFVDGDAVVKYTVSFVPNTEDFELRFAVPVPTNAPLGSQFCNYAKTTAAPSASPASNRKAGPACFTVGGGLRIEKRSGSVEGPLLGGAAFNVVCTPPPALPGSVLPPTIITGLSQASATNQDGSVSATGTSASGSVAIVGPSGTPCTVTETAAPPGYQIDPTPRNLVIPVGTDQTVNVFVNRQLAGLVVTKSTVGGTGTFTFHVDCAGSEFDQDVVITGSGSASVIGIPVGTECTVTEEADDLFTSFSVPADGAVTIGEGANTVSFTNTRNTGNLVVDKTTLGGTGTFTFDVHCDGETFDRELTITDSGSRIISGIPTGTSCTVTEQTDPLFTTVSDPANGTVTIAGGDNTVTFTNTRNTGSLVVAKTTTGGSGTFTFDVDCDGTAFDQAVTISNTGSQTISGIPTATTCTVTERPDPAFTSASTPADAAVTIGASAATVAFTNTAKPTAVTLDKKVNGGDHATAGDALAAHGGDALTYTVVVTNTGQVPVTVAALTDSLRPGLAGACPQGVGSTLAAGSSFTCTYTVTAGGDATNVASVTAVDGLQRRSTDSDSTFVKVLNPAIAISKTASPNSVSGSGDVTFSYTVTNTGDAALAGVTVTDDVLGGIGVIGDLAPGAAITLSRTQTVTASSPTRNIGTVTGTDVLGRKVSASDPEDITIVLGVLLELPRTGGRISLLATAGLGFVLTGLVLMVGGRRRRDA